MGYFTAYTRQQLREIAVEEYEANATIPVASDAGSGLGSFYDGVSLTGMVNQRQQQYLALISRLATIPANADGSPNPDVDSFCSPFIGPRGGQQFATGPVTLSTPSIVSTQLVVLVGVAVVASSSNLIYTVIADPTNTAYSAELGGYPINPNQNSVTVTVRCQTAGIVGNAQAGQINAPYAGPGAQPFTPSISTISNPSNFITGSPYETDAQYKARFQARMVTGQGGTLYAMSAALMGIAPGVTWTIQDRVNANGVATGAYFTVYVAMLGQTEPTPATLLGQAKTVLEGNPPAILPTRPAGISYAVVSPQIQPVNVSAAVTVAPGFAQATVQANCVAAVTEFINGLGLPGFGATTTLQYLQLAAILYGVAGVAKVDALLVTVNATPYQNDVLVSYQQLFCAGTVTFAMTGGT